MEHSEVTDPATFATAFDQALNAGDLDRLLRLYDPQACIRTSEGPVVECADLISRELNNLISAKAHLENRLRQLFRRGEVALIVVDYTLQINTPDGQRIAIEGTATNVLEHTPEHGWRMIIANPEGSHNRLL